MSTVAQAAAEEHPLGERSIFSDRAISDRIAPVGAVCLEGQDECITSNTEDAADTNTVIAANEALTPEGIFNSNCTMCHSAGIGGAPKPGSEDWQTRLTEKGMDQLVQNAINGINAMPPKGMCGSCSSEDLQAAIEFMINKH